MNNHKEPRVTEQGRFEEWAELTIAQKHGAQHDVTGWYYFDEVTQDRWEAWQARAALDQQTAPCMTISSQGVSYPDGSHISPDGTVTGPLAEAMARKIEGTASVSIGGQRWSKEAEMMESWAAALAQQGAAQAPRLRGVMAENSPLVQAHRAVQAAHAGADAERDAARYRWLRNEARSVDWSNQWRTDAYSTHCRSSATQMDRVIDAAIAASQPQKGSEA